MNFYSQYGEDKFLWNYIKENKIDIPHLFVDVGALDGLRNSNSRAFMEQGWFGILIEPNPHVFKLIDQNCKGLEYLSYNVAISNKIGYFKFKIQGKKIRGDSHLTEDGNIAVYTTTLDKIVTVPIGILDIDTEGHDFIIIKNVFKKKIFPVFIIIEANTETLFKKQQKLLSKKYKLLRRKDVNSIWIKNKIW